MISFISLFKIWFWPNLVANNFYPIVILLIPVIQDLRHFYFKSALEFIFKDMIYYFQLCNIVWWNLTLVICPLPIQLIGHNRSIVLSIIDGYLLFRVFDTTKFLCCLIKSFAGILVYSQIDVWFDIIIAQWYQVICWWHSIAQTSFLGIDWMHIGHSIVILC